jgi:hypothetical protein
MKEDEELGGQETHRGYRCQLGGGGGGDGGGGGWTWEPVGGNAAKDH